MLLILVLLDFSAKFDLLDILDILWLDRSAAGESCEQKAMAWAGGIAGLIG